METEKVGHPSDMDAVMAYRNYLAAEDHLDELIFRAPTTEEKFILEAMQEETIWLRDQIMPAEADPMKHCLVKHYAAAYEGVRERWKDLKTEQLFYAKKHAFELLINALEMLWDRHIITCERCDYERTARRDTEQATSDGKSRPIVYSVGLDREPSIQGVSGTRESGSGTDSSELEAYSGESEGITHHNWDRHGEDSPVGSQDSPVDGRLRES